MSKVWVLLVFLALVNPLVVKAQGDNETQANVTEEEPQANETSYSSEWVSYFKSPDFQQAGSKIWKGVMLLSAGLRDLLAIAFDAVYYAATGQRISPEKRGIAATILGFLSLYWFLRRKLNWALGSWVVLAIALFAFFNLSSLGGA